MACCETAVIRVMALCKTVVTNVLIHWSNHSFAPTHRYNPMWRLRSLTQLSFAPKAIVASTALWPTHARSARVYKLEEKCTRTAHPAKDKWPTGWVRRPVVGELKMPLIGWSFALIVVRFVREVEGQGRTCPGSSLVSSAHRFRWFRVYFGASFSFWWATISVGDRKLGFLNSSLKQLTCGGSVKWSATICRWTSSISFSSSLRANEQNCVARWDFLWHQNNRFLAWKNRSILWET